MRKYIKKIGKYKIKRTRFDWIVVNCDSGSHAHFKSKRGCESIIHMINEDIEPDNPYFVESMRRLTEVKRKKQYYININKGIRG